MVSPSPEHRDATMSDLSDPSAGPTRLETPIRNVATKVSAIVVVGALVGVAYWGHVTEWRFHLLDQRAHVDVPGAEPQSSTEVKFGSIASENRELPSAFQRSATISFRSMEAVELTGIDVSGAWSSSVTESISASAEARFDPGRTARLSARVPGTASRVFKKVGDFVKVGDLLAIIDAAEVGRAKSEFQQALVQMRLKQTALTNIGAAGAALPERQRREAEAAVRDAEVRLLSTEQSLLNLGLPASVAEYRNLPMDEIAQRIRRIGLDEANNWGLDQKDLPATTNLLPIRSSMEGVILSVDVVTGEVVEAGRPLFVIVDPRQMWLTLHVPQLDARRIALGQEVRFRPDGSSEEFVGKVSWIGTAADETTRTVPIRAAVDNSGGRLRASTLGFGRVVIRTDPNAVVIPHDAVLSLHGVEIVFLRDPKFLKSDDSKAFHLRVVRVGARDGDNIEILSGVKVGDVVANKGARFLLNEWRRAGEKSSNEK